MLLQTGYADTFNPAWLSANVMGALPFNNTGGWGLKWDQFDLTLITSRRVCVRMVKGIGGWCGWEGVGRM